MTKSGSIKHFIFILVISAALPACSGRENNPYLENARKAARWIESTVVENDGQKIWPVTPEDGDVVVTNLYSGTSGTILFFLELYQTTQNRSYLDSARMGADFLLSHAEKETQNGLYTGLAGVGFSLEETYRASGEDKYRKGFLACLDSIRKNARQMDGGVDWGETTDIISGNTGTGLFLLYAAERLEDSSWMELAAKVGDRLIEVGQETETGTKWFMNPEYPRNMPNFSHGTAGTAFFLAALYEKTKDRKYLDASIKGANYLLSIADTEGDVCQIFHHEPEGEDLFYMGWCHGPVGTARLFYQLYKVTGDESWMDWVKKSARAVLNSGIPENPTPGFWNNVGQCCGSAGIAEFFLNLHRSTGDPEYLSFVKRLTDQIMSKGTEDDSGLRWIHAEHRVRPEFLQAQTGLMQGAAGIGLWLLHLDAFDKGTKPKISLPDDPF